MPITVVGEKSPAAKWLRRRTAQISPLRGLLEVSRLVRAEGVFPALLGAIARTISDSLGYETVVINLYRPAWDDFCVTTVHGGTSARGTSLLGQVRRLGKWEPLLVDRFCRRGAFVIPKGADDSGTIGAEVRARPSSPTGPGGWQPEDALLVPMRHSDGHLLGILSVDEPKSGLRAGDEELDVLAALSAHAALAVQATQESADAARHRLALEELLAVSSRLYRRARRERDPARRLQRHPRRTRLPQCLRTAGRSRDEAAGAARGGRLGDGGPARRRRRAAHGRRAAARPRVRDRGLLPAAGRGGARAASSRRSDGTSRT